MTRTATRLTATEMRFTPPVLENAELQEHLETCYGIASDGFKRLSGERDLNHRIRTQDGRALVLKVSSRDEDPAGIEFQIDALEHIKARDPALAVPRMIATSDGALSSTLEAGDGKSYNVRLLTFVPGVPTRSMEPLSLSMIEMVGETLGRLARALDGFTHPASDHFMPWDILNGLVVSPEFIADLLPADLAEDCGDALQRLRTASLPAMAQLPAQVIHNDGHEGNVMRDPNGEPRITGVIDFGDMVRRPLLVDVATSLNSYFERSEDPLATSTAFLRGYDRWSTLSDAHRALLLDAILARALLTVQLLTFRIHNNDADAEQLCQLDLPLAKKALRKALAIDPNDFARAAARQAAIV